jgi:hypothetical protein
MSTAIELLAPASQGTSIGVHTLGTGERFEPGCEEAAEVNANHFALAAGRQITADSSA